MYVTGVGHTSLSSASIRSGEIIIPSKMWHQRGTLTYPRFRTGALRTPGTGGVGSPGLPRGGHLMISPLCICRRCGRDGRRGRCRRAGTQGQKRDRGGYTVSGYVSQVWEEVWEVSGADAAAAAAGRLPRSGFDIMAGARFVLQRGGGAVRSGPVAGGAA